MSTTFRPFKFFSNETVSGNSGLAQAEITAITSSRSGNLVTGDASGVIRVYDRNLEKSNPVLHEFTAYEGPVTHLKMAKGRNVVVSLGDDKKVGDAATAGGGDMNIGIVRLWDLDRQNKSTRKPSMKEHCLFGPGKGSAPSPEQFVPIRTNYNDSVTAKMHYMMGTEMGEDGSVAVKNLRTCAVSFDLADDLQLLAVGLCTGEVIFIKGDLERERSVRMRRAKSKYAAHHELTFVGIPRVHPVTKSGPIQTTLPTAHFTSLVYVVYRDCVTVWRVTTKGDFEEDRLRTPGATGGAKNECAVINDAELVVAFDDNSTVCTWEENFIVENATRWDPGAYLPLTKTIEVGERHKISCFKNYIMVLSRKINLKDQTKYELQLFDLNIQIRALHNQQSNLINPAWLVPLGSGDLLVCTQEGREYDKPSLKVNKLSEVDMQARLDQLFSKHLYTEAQKMVRKSEKFSVDVQMDIERKHGDHLYGRGKTDEAVEKYIHAIGYLEPSYVIRKFLDSQKGIHNLTRYLEELHHTKHGAIANRNHTTLLLNCYTKQKDETNLQMFIQRRDVTFDVSNGIKVCMEAGYYDAATYLAKTHDRPAEYVKIEMDHRHNYQEALEFIRTCSVDAAEDILLDHGKELLAHVPAETTDVLIKLCSEWPGPERKLAGGSSFVAFNDRTHSSTTAAEILKKHPHRAEAGQYIPTFVDSPLCLLHFLEEVEKVENQGAQSDGARLVFNTLLELYLTPELQGSIRTVKTAQTPGSPTGRTAEAEAAMALVGMRQSSRSVLPGGGSPGSFTGGGGDSQKFLVAPPPDVRHERAMQLLTDQEGSYDPYHALVLVQQYHFERGIIFMLQSLKLYKEIFAYYARRFEDSTSLSQRKDAKDKLIRSCENRRGADPQEEREMWISLLSVLMQSKDEVSEDITRVLNKIEQDDLLPPIAVIDILSSNPTLELQTVRDYMLKMLAKEYNNIETDQRQIKFYGDKTKRHQEDIHELQTSAIVFQSNKCSACSGPLDNPAIHFMCRHSFHERCLNEANVCNNCGPEHGRALEAQGEFQRTDGGSQQQFFSDLRQAGDGFDVVAEYFGRSIFSDPTRDGNKNQGEDSDEDGFGGYEDGDMGGGGEDDDAW